MGYLVVLLATVVGGLVILFLVARWYDRKRDVTDEYHAGQLTPQPPVSRGGDSEPASIPVYRWAPRAVSETHDVAHDAAPDDDDDDSQQHGAW